MTVTMNLRPDIEAQLEAAADRKNLPVSDYVASLVELAILEEPAPDIQTGADLLAYWQQIGFVGMWADREEMRDSTEWVNRQQQERQQKTRDKLGLNRNAE